MRDKIEQLYAAKVFDCGSMAEMTPWMNVAGSAQTSGMLCWQDIVYTEVCDPTTMRRVPYGERGTPVYTHLERTSQPMIRLVSGDLTLWSNEPNPCGRTYPRLPNGIFGRILARLSPLCHKHFNMLGRYHFAVPEEVLRGELRPLRDSYDAGEELLIA